MRTKRHPRNELISGIDAALFVHVAVLLSFVLLLFFLASPAPFHGSLSVDLPRVGHAVLMTHADREDAMTIVIFRDHKVFFRNERVRPDQLPAKIRDSVSRGSERKVYIRADARAKYSWVAEVLDNVRSGGIENVGFLVSERQIPVPSRQ